MNAHLVYFQIIQNMFESHPVIVCHQLDVHSSVSLFSCSADLQPVMMSSVMGGCSLALVMLLLVSIDAKVTEFSDCSEYFLDNIPPVIPGVVEGGNNQDQNRYQAICQTYKDKARYMTLYDTTEKIPVFSAYKYTGHIEGIDRPDWMIEPQVI